MAVCKICLLKVGAPFEPRKPAVSAALATIQAVFGKLSDTDSGIFRVSYCVPTRAKPNVSVAYSQTPSLGFLSILFPASVSQEVHVNAIE